jgi:hypothetical protein
MRQTILQLTQSILAELGGDEITSIETVATNPSSDVTTEALDIVEIIKQTYFKIITQENWRHIWKLTSLDSASTSQETHVYIGDNVAEIEWLKYDKQSATDSGRTKYSDVTYKFPDEFMSLINSRVSTDTNITTVTGIDGGALLIRNDLAPSCWTSFDDKYIIFDSYDAAIDTAGTDYSKTQVYAKVLPTWTDDDDTFVPDLPTESFPYLKEKALSRAYRVINQVANDDVDRDTMTLKRRASQNSWVSKSSNRTYNYGRRGGRR